MKGLILAVAAWMRYVGGVDDAGAAIDVRDPMADHLKALSDAADTPAAKVQALLSVTEIFPATLHKNADFFAGVIAAFEGLVAQGARKMVEAYHD
jgi:fructuronate reductase